MKPKNIIVSGATGGIGHALCNRFLALGHRVFALCRNKEKFDRVFEPHAMLEPIIFDFNLIDRVHINKLWDTAIGTHAVDVVINNAGALIYKPFEQFEVNEIEELFKINFLTPAIIIQSLLSKMATPAHIVNISTMGAVQGSTKFAGLSFYGATKAALQNLTETLAVELTERKIAANALALGAVQTPMLESAFPGIKNAISPNDMAKFICDFALEGHTLFNAKVLPISNSTP